MIINHNISALNTYRQLSTNNVLQNKSLEKLSSGLRINRAGDDAAGLAISEKMRGQIRGLNMAQKNAQDGISLIQTAEGALNEVHAILQRMRELAVQAANDTNNDNDRSELQKEVDQLLDEIDRIANNTEFNTKRLLDGSLTQGAGGASGSSGSTGSASKGPLVFHIGANENQNIKLEIASMKTGDLGLRGGSGAGGVSGASGSTGSVDISTQSGANNAIATIQNAIDKVSSERAKLGAYQNRLEHTINNLGASAENLQAAESRIRDVDMAKEMMEFTKMNILSQAATAMLAQANQQPQLVLQLLR